MVSAQPRVIQIVITVQVFDRGIIDQWTNNRSSFLKDKDVGEFIATREDFL